MKIQYWIFYSIYLNDELFSTEESLLKDIKTNNFWPFPPRWPHWTNIIYIYNLYITFIGVYAVLNMGLKVSLVVLFVIPLYFSLSVYGQVVSPGTCPNIPTVRPFNVGHVSILFIIFLKIFFFLKFLKKKTKRIFI